MATPVPSNQSGIYAITNTLNGKQYIGSSMNIPARWRHHRHTLTQGNHHSRHLQAAWNRYGPDAFTFTMIECVLEVTRLIEREQFYLDARFAERGSMEYNNRPTAESNLGYRRSAESRARMSAKYKGRPNIWAYKLRGQKRSPEARERIGKPARGRKLSDEWKRHISEGMRTARLTEKELARRARISEACKERNAAAIADGRQREYLAMLHSPENRAKAGRANSIKRTAEREAFLATLTDDTLLLCKRCKQEKPARDFHRNPVGFTRRQPYCKECQLAYKREQSRKRRTSTITNPSLWEC